MREVEHAVLRPTLSGMAAEDRPYTGCLYIGLMLTSRGPRVIEYNCRFGDPETQVVLPLFQGDLAQLLLVAATGGMEPTRFPSWRADDPSTAVCVVIAAGGYPDHYESGDLIGGLEDLKAMEGVVAFHAGTRRGEGGIVTAGGRVLGITAMESSTGFASTLARCYDAVRRIRFDRMHYRRDIGFRALLPRQ
jgi:phosphoribosylamine--glycine ligase